MPSTGHISLKGIEDGHIHHKCVFANTKAENTISIHEKIQANMPKRTLKIIYNGISHININDSSITAAKLPDIPEATPDIFPDINIPVHNTTLARNIPAA